MNNTPHHHTASFTKSKDEQVRTIVTAKDLLTAIEANIEARGRPIPRGVRFTYGELSSIWHNLPPTNDHFKKTEYPFDITSLYGYDVHTVTRETLDKEGRWIE